jgi:hypothetical protein
MFQPSFKMFQDEKNKKDARADASFFSMETRVNSRKNNVLYIYSCDLSFCVYETKKIRFATYLFSQSFYTENVEAFLVCMLKNIK